LVKHGKRGEGLRLGTVRRPPLGVPRRNFAGRNYYDVWLPLLSPSADLVKLAQAAQTDGDEKSWRAFARRFRAEMGKGDAPRVLDMLAALSHQTDGSVAIVKTRHIATVPCCARYWKKGGPGLPARTPANDPGANCVSGRNSPGQFLLDAS
jgi:uncharacterized protein YeaO (DUF488 family)